jgi:hypothetical protein
MGRFGANEVDNYGGSGGSSFFTLKDDGDVAQVRFMYNSMEDVVGYAVHEVEIDGKKRYVNCLRSYNEPKSKCPFCNANSFQRAKLYIPLYDIENDEVKIWERGKNFFPKMSSICARYSKADTPLVAHTFDIERRGKKGDTSTTYEIYETGCDDTLLEDLPELPEVLGTIILDKSAEDMEYYLDYGVFPNPDGAPQRSASTRTDRPDRPERSRREESQPTGRRTPSRRGDSQF